jgi:flagellar hook-associated protein 1 FlgK
VVTTLYAKMTYETTGGAMPVLTATFANTKFKLDDTKVGGQLGGLGDYKTNTLLPLQKSISEIAEQMSGKINTVLAGGFKSHRRSRHPAAGLQSVQRDRPAADHR